MTQFEGTFDGQGMKVGIVVARFNEFITAKLLSGAQDNLIRHGVKKKTLMFTGYPVPLKFPI